MAALLDDVLGMLERELAEAGLEGLAWRERVRGGLAVILGFFDREPALARVCVVHSQQGGAVILARREEVFARLAGAIDEARGESAARGGLFAVDGGGPGGCCVWDRVRACGARGAPAARGSPR